MLDVRRLVTSVRYRLGDMQGARYSDFEIIEALNRASSLLFSRLGKRFVWAAVKKTIVVVDKDSLAARLPRDFHSVRRVTSESLGELTPSAGNPREWEYRIAGNTFRGVTGAGAYGLEYYYIPRDVHDLDAELDAPEAVSPWLEQITAAVLGGDGAGAAQIAESCCESLAGGEASRIPELGPVRILGGRL